MKMKTVNSSTDKPNRKPPPEDKYIGLGSTISKIGTSATKNSLRMRFTLPLRTDSLYPCKINWRIRAMTVVPYPMNNGVVFCPPWRLNITGNICGSYQDACNL